MGGARGADQGGVFAGVGAAGAEEGGDGEGPVWGVVAVWFGWGSGEGVGVGGGLECVAWEGGGGVFHF